jgi:hypothetical protein
MVQETTPKEAMVTLESSDGELFEVPKAAAEVSDLVKDSLGDEDDDVPSNPISILRVKKDCMKKVVDFMKEYHKDPMNEIPTPLGGNTFAEVSAVPCRGLTNIESWVDLRRLV